MQAPSALEGEIEIGTDPIINRGCWFFVASAGVAIVLSPY
jgi:hypothetical protein